jgi:tetratricopeptide (TPR) repeat protein
MLKISILFLVLVLSGVAGAKEEKKKLSDVYSEKGYHYSALNAFFIETFNKPITVGMVSRLEELLYYTGIEILEDYEVQLLKKYPSSSTRFIIGRKAYQKKNFKEALEFFDLMHPDHRFFPESRMMVAEIYAKQDKFDKQDEATNTCRQTSEKLEGTAINKKIKRYFRMINEICLVNRARHLFNRGKFQEAIDAYDKIPKVSYKWPYILLEKAWVYYQMGDYNRALGLLVTYKSPLLNTYFFPEAEYLTALAYFKMCLYDDSLTVISQYYESYRPRFNSLSAVLKKNMRSQDYFYDLMFKPGDELKKHEEFVRQIITRLKKQVRYSLDFNTIHKVNSEMREIVAKESKAEQKKLVPHLHEVKTNMVSKINYNAKSDIFQFLETVPFFSEELFKLNLETISRKKDLVYKNKKLIADRSRGDYSNVNRSRFEYFWKFHGAFWADELGDYSLGLKSNCRAVRIEEERK